MNIKEWNTHVESSPATGNQRGRIMSEFERLGYHWKRDREARLHDCAMLSGLPSLDSIRDLTQGQAGHLVKLLSTLENRAELESAVERAVERASQSGNPYAAIVIVTAVMYAAVRILRKHPVFTFIKLTKLA
jgi:hypothetical protein